MSETKQIIDQLPVLVSRKVFCQVTGLSRYQVEQLRATKQIRHWLPPGKASGPKSKGRYYREDLRRILCLE